MSESKRLFFAVNIPEEVKRRISENVLTVIPGESWGKVPEENLHVTMLFLGQLPAEAVERLRAQAGQLRDFRGFDAELQGIGHFNGRILWIGFGKGGDEFRALCEKLQAAVGVRDERFHPHVTLARNKRMGHRETVALAEKLQKTGFSAKISVKSIELMESILQQPAPKYRRVFSAEFAATR
jgi:2'-5' RNA ligase